MWQIKCKLLLPNNKYTVIKPVREKVKSATGK